MIYWISGLVVVGQTMEPSDKIMAVLQRIILMQAKEIAKIPLLIARIEIFERELARYKTKKDSNNSSLPPSKDENRPPRISSLREKGGRKTGGQPGHNGKTLEMTNNPDEIVEHHACFCPECGKDISSQPWNVRPNTLKSVTKWIGRSDSGLCSKTHINLRNNLRPRVITILINSELTWKMSWSVS